EEQFEKALECAEHVLTYLAVLALAQLADAEPLARLLPGTRLRSFYRDQRLTFDWGKCKELVREGVEWTLKSGRAFDTRFPGLAELDRTLFQPGSEGARAEEWLQRERNAKAHLQRLPDDQMVERSTQAVAHLDSLFQSAAFLALVPLVQVEECSLHPVTGRRTATFRMMQGISSVFRRRSGDTEQELGRGALGFLDRTNRFVDATPWILGECCPQCGRRETFLFNRLEKDAVTYVAMETGHPAPRPDLVPRFLSLLEEA
ncbi:MAG: hypothetical protein L0170_14535, partial [Acidobacteria bacterium]|nr:hypothetical protein [Acidobacteriota bacterium]